MKYSFSELSQGRPFSFAVKLDKANDKGSNAEREAKSRIEKGGTNATGDSRNASRFSLSHSLKTAVNSPGRT